MKRILFALCLAVCITAPAWAEPVRVFNLPLGGKLDRRLPKCSQSAKPDMDFCWIDEPIPLNTKSKFVIVGTPTEKLPEWVGAGLAKLSIDGRGTLESIHVDVDENSLNEAIASISQRFGRPNENFVTHNGIRATKWNRVDIEIDLLCGTGACFVEFLSESRVAQINQAREKIKQRPTTP